MFRRLALALQFLTTLPIKVRGTVSEIDEARSMIWYPAVGLLIGGVLVLVHTAASQVLGPGVSAFLVVLTYCLMTGAIHLDGMADSADALFSGPNKKDRILEIMRDSRIGTMGVVALILTLAAKILLIAALGPAFKMSALLLMCPTGRFTAVIAAFIMPYARQGEVGIAKPHCEHLRFLDIFLSVLIYSAALLFVHLPKLVLIYSVVFLYTAILLRYFKSRVGGLTGDLLGALIESTEIVTLLAILCVTNIWGNA